MKEKLENISEVAIPENAKEVLPGWYSLGQIGQGAFGTVLKVTNGETLAAAKVYKDNVERGKTALTTFNNETDILAELDHPHIPKLLAKGEVEDEFDPTRVKPAMVMELVEGQTLEEVINRGAPVPENHVLDITLQLLKTLDYAHKTTGKVHRDLGPQNAMRTGDKKIVITDFGMAREPTEGLASSLMSQREENQHRVEYLGVEALIGDPQPQSDVYSVAQIARALLKGEHVNRNLEENEFAGLSNKGFGKWIEQNTNSKWKERSATPEKALKDLETYLQATEVVVKEKKPRKYFTDRPISYLLPIFTRDRDASLLAHLVGAFGGAAGIGMGLGLVEEGASALEAFQSMGVGALIGMYAGTWIPRITQGARKIVNLYKEKFWGNKEKKKKEWFKTDDRKIGYVMPILSKRREVISRGINGAIVGGILGAIGEPTYQYFSMLEQYSLVGALRMAALGSYTGMMLFGNAERVLDEMGEIVFRIGGLKDEYIRRISDD